MAQDLPNQLKRLLAVSYTHLKSIKPFRYIFILMILSGAFLKLDAIWILADIVNGLMALPNLIALICLSGIIVSETKKYMQHLKSQKNK